MDADRAGGGYLSAETSSSPEFDADAVEWIAPTGDAVVGLTCEHASERVPSPFVWPDADQRLVGTHWAIDLGAADLTRELAKDLGAPAVLARFSRLLVDVNRPLESDTLFRTVADDVDIEFNKTISPDERVRRLSYYRAYHQAVDWMTTQCAVPHLFAVHSFTPTYEGTLREMEVAILFDHEDSLAGRLAAAFEKAGFETRLNEPYSGKLGMMYSVSRAAEGRASALEIEVRQDLAQSPATRARVVSVIGDFYRSLAAR